LITCNCQNRKTETACLASRTNPDNNEKSLKCDDECARLERNRNLAEALDINPETHKDDHIPYSTTTLRMYHDSTKWAQEREREFRLFAADALEKRLRFKPMQSHQRAFIHALAEDFGFDSESLDPEPYRHVVIFKTPRFVMAPMKSLSDCLQIRLAAVEASTFTAATTSLGSNTQSNDEQYNGFLLVEPRFGLTLDELRADFFPIFITAPSLVFDISFLPSEKIVIKGRPTKSWAMSATTLGYNVKSLKSALLATATSKKIAASLILCALDSSLNILRLENDSTLKSGGWSQVAAKAASSARSAPMQSSVGVRSSFTVLGTKGIKKKKEEAKSRVVDDWEEAARREEEWELEQERLEMSHTLESGGGGGAKASGLVQCAPCAGDDALS
jgi:transcriptional repressor NF-X1